MNVACERILESITRKVTRDNRKKFTDETRLNYIKSELENSDYEIMNTTDLAVIYKKKNVDLDENIVLISTHVDCVDAIHEPDFQITMKGNYKGTFDNAATNAVAVISMLENMFSDNVLIAFTGDEEETQNGAKQVIGYLEKENKKVIAISLDVTFDLISEKGDISTYKDASYTIDNVCKNSNERIIQVLFKIANDLGIPFMVTRADSEHEDIDYFEKKDIVITEYYDKRKEVKDTAYEDEALTYCKNKSCIGAFSLCLPTNDTDDDDGWKMHSNDLIKIKKVAFDEYMKAVLI